MSNKRLISIIFILSFLATIFLFNLPITTAQNRMQAAKDAALALTQEKCGGSGEQCSTCVQKNVLPKIFSEYRITNAREKSEIYSASIKGC
jgi:hypothetical protein